MTHEAPPPPPPPDQGDGPPAGKPHHERPDKTERTRLIGGIVIAIVAMWFVMANLHHVDVTFWVVTVTSPMWLTLAGTFLAGMAAALLLTRSRKRKP